MGADEGEGGGGERETEKLALWVHIHVASPQQLISTNQLVQLIGPPL